MPWSKYQVSVAAEAFAAAQFARFGYKVSVQYGANQPEYDLIVGKEDRLLAVSVKGSSDGGWALTQGYLAAATEKSGKKADYQGAIDIWVRKHPSSPVMCFVQFDGVDSQALPRMYLAPFDKVIQHMRQGKQGLGLCMLNENHELTKGPFKGLKESIPEHWLFSEARADYLLTCIGIATLRHDTSGEELFDAEDLA